jgi:hypothetical protein
LIVASGIVRDFVVDDPTGKAQDWVRNIIAAADKIA